MSLEPIGFLMILAGFACFAFGPSVAVAVFMNVMLLGAAAAAFLTALGGANIQPAHLLLAFIAADVLLRPALLQEALRRLRFPQAGFWLLLTVGYGLAVTLIMPRLFAGATYVFAPARTDGGVVDVLTIPLGPSSANVTQSVYFVGDAICFAAICAYSGRPGAARDIVRAATLCGAINLCFVVIDLATYYTGTAELLSFLRNSSYRLLDDAEMAGFKRIVGSFTEAAAFAYITLALFAFSLRLWIEGIAVRATGAIALLSAVALVFATSSTGYVGLAAILSLQSLRGIARLLAGRATQNTLVLLGLAPVALAVVAAGILLSPQLRASIGDLADLTLFNKLSSDSGIERSAWNRQAIGAIRDTLWLGAGIGSLRASSWLVAVPANIGAVGAAAYGAFLLAVLFGRHPDDDPLAAAVRGAAREACIAQVVAASVAGSFIDLGLSFFLFAAVACGRLPAPDRPRSWHSSRLDVPARLIRVDLRR